MSQFYALVKTMLVMSHCEVIAAFKARCLFRAINLEILCNLCTENCENNAFENTDTLDGWLCNFFFLTVVLLNASSTSHQRSFRIKDPSVAYGMATVQ